MKNVTDSFVSLGHWPSAGSFGFNTDILATNLINLSVVLGVLIFLERECVRVRILNTIRNSRIARRASNSWKKPGLDYGNRIEADEFRVNGYSEIEREK
uniref:Uncharacterized protein n=1 Tax=Helianthus annuus TaxID=4232 RepID=A0A1Y3BTK9_HELAN